MIPAETEQVIETLRGTWDEILSHSEQIPRTSRVEVRVLELASTSNRQTPTMALMQTWLQEDATDDPDEIREAEADLREFKRNMNQPRKQAGARLLYSGVE